MKRLKQLGLGVLRNKDKEVFPDHEDCIQRLPSAVERITQRLQSSLAQRINGLRIGTGKSVMRTVNSVRKPEDLFRLK